MVLLALIVDAGDRINCLNVSRGQIDIPQIFRFNLYANHLHLEADNRTELSLERLVQANRYEWALRS